MFVDAIQFAGSVVGVDRRCAGTYGEDHANFPRSLSFQRPAQDFEFPRRQRRRRDRNRQRHQNFRCRLTPERGFCRSPKSRRRIPACVQFRDPKLSGRQYESSLHQTPTPMSVYRGGLVDLCRSTSPLPAQMRGRRHPSHRRDPPRRQPCRVAGRRVQQARQRAVAGRRLPGPAIEVAT